MKKGQVAIFLFLILITVGFLMIRKPKSIEEIFREDAILGEKIPVVIVPHFNSFADKRAELLADVGKKTSAKTIVLVSVNHFNSGSENILTTDKTWLVSGGEVSAEKTLVEKISDDKIAANDETAFAQEHGIANIIPDIYKFSPKAKVLPIIIKDQTGKGQIDKLSNWISDNCQNCLLVASVDFSHYQPSSLARVHDSFSISALSNLDFNKTWKAETDSPQTLYLAEKIAEKNKAKNFHLFYNASTGDLSEAEVSEVTSVVLGYYSSMELSDSEKIEPSSTFVIAGDAMFDRNVWHNYKNKGLKTIFDNFGTRVFRGADLSALNLEGPISSSAINDDWRSGSMVFNFPPETPSILKYLNIDAVSLANNHSANAGVFGFANTKKILSDAGINYFGQPEGFSESSVLRVDGEIPLSIIGIMALSDFDHATLNEKIKTEKLAGRFVIIFPHWGEEYKSANVASQKSLANEWSSAGADLIVGSHPHVVEDFQIVNDRPVIYSLGNFVFDQFFSKETQEGLIVAGKITKDKITLSFLPTKEKLVKPEFMVGAEKTAKISTIFDINSENKFKKLSPDTIEINR